MAEEKTVAEIESMTTEEMQAYEDQLEAEAQGVTPDAPGDPEPSGVPAASSEDDPAADPAAKPADGEQDPAPAAAAGVEPEPQTPAKPDEDLTKHVSPPSKWKQQRLDAKKAKTLEEQNTELQAKAAKADELEGKVEGLTQQIDWLTNAMKGRGIEIPADPKEIFTDEKIANVREEHGDDLADMLTAVRATRATTPKPQEPGEQPPAAPPAEPAAAPAAQGPDPAIVAAIEENDELTWWREQSPALWAKAVAKDESLLQDPTYVALSYPKRYARVVDEVKAEVMKTGSAVNPDDGKPPTSLSGSDGIVPEPIENDALTKMEAIADPTKQLEYYRSLPEDVRDQVDKALNI